MTSQESPTSTLLLEGLQIKTLYTQIPIYGDINRSLVGERSESEKCDHPPVIHTPDEVALSKKLLLMRSFCENLPDRVIVSMETLWQSKHYHENTTDSLLSQLFQNLLGKVCHHYHKHFHSHSPVLIISQEFALGVISAPREAATGFPRLCYAYFSFAMTQCVGFSGKLRKILALKLMLMMNTTPTRWDSKTYKWSVVVRQEPEAGDVLEVSVQHCEKLPENHSWGRKCSLSRWRVTSALALFKWWPTVCLLFLLTLCKNREPDTNCRKQTYRTQSKENKIVECNK